jgi:hypothetical protein
MNPITKVLNRQAQITKSSFSTPEVVSKMLQTPQLEAIIDPFLQTSRKRLYGPVETLSMFISQTLSTDRSCQNVVNQTALYDERCSIATGGYCRARQRLDSTMVMQLSHSIAQHNETKASASWQWRGREVYLVDGTTLIMPDTPANQERYPQTSSLPEGVGFPICRLVGIVSLATGSLIDAAISPFRGKGASEQTLLRSMLHRFKPGDVVLADAFYSTYFLIAHMLAHDIDIVFVQHGARTRTTDFSKGVQLGKNDHLITLVKPKQKPEWLDQDTYEATPDSLCIREFKAAGKTLITTMTCAKTHSKKELGNLYKKRWHIEVDLRNLKTIMGLETLSCKTPEMAIKELWVYFLAYNMIRSIMLASALYACVLPRMLSFKHTLQLTLAFHGTGTSLERFLTLIAQKRVGNRPGRIEPRVIKRRHNDYRLMMKPRDILREEVRKNGHPKKVK